MTNNLFKEKLNQRTMNKLYQFNQKVIKMQKKYWCKTCKKVN